MKLFHNPYVVGGLALVACLLVYRNAIHPLVTRNAPRDGKAVTRAPAPAPAPAPAGVDKPATRRPSTTSTRAASPRAAARSEAPDARIDLEYLGWEVTEAPSRDPFQLLRPTVSPTRKGPPAGEVLTLTAIWRQTGESLAVINGRILAPGNTIAGFEIESIEANSVWVLGPEGREPLEFRTRSGTNASPATPGTVLSGATGRGDLL